MLDEIELKTKLLEANRAGLPFVFPSGLWLACTFAGALLDKAHLEKVKLGGSDFRFASMVDARLEEVDLSSCRAQEAGLARTVFHRVDFSRGHFSQAVMNWAQLSECGLVRSFFDGVYARELVLKDCKATASCWDTAELWKTRWCRVQAERSSFEESDLRRAELRDCALCETDFSLADLRGASFVSCDLRDTIFHGAMFQDTVFRDCNLDGASLNMLDRQGCLIS